jgi:hypothetical protein
MTTPQSKSTSPTASSVAGKLVEILRKFVFEMGKEIHEQADSKKMGT